jgi:molybdenum-dependent DNA-binding transcriptional regulator ModE
MRRQRQHFDFVRMLNKSFARRRKRGAEGKWHDACRLHIRKLYRFRSRQYFVKGGAMTRFTLKQLKYFVTVVETESIAEASRQLHIAQPSISIAIKNLESTFEQQLFIRHHAQGVSLTSCGRRFYDKAKELLRLSYEFEQNSRADKELVSGTISVGCFESVAPLYMPKLVAGFKKCIPISPCSCMTVSSMS